jgi:hypothetical protein
VVFDLPSALILKSASPGERFNSSANAPVEYTLTGFSLINIRHVLQVEPIINCLEENTVFVILDGLTSFKKG